MTVGMGLLRNQLTALVLAGIVQLRIWSFYPILLVVPIIIICQVKTHFLDFLQLRFPGVISKFSV